MPPKKSRNITSEATQSAKAQTYWVVGYKAYQKPPSTCGEACAQGDTIAQPVSGHDGFALTATSDVGTRTHSSLPKGKVKAAIQLARHKKIMRYRAQLAS